MAASDQIFRPKPPSLKIMEAISQGAHGSVHFGELDGRPVAVKRIRRALLEAPRGQSDFEQVMADFQRECQLLEQVHHPHVVNFRGAFYDETTEEPLLVMERMRENLRDFLVRNRNDLSRKRQLEICLGVVRGLQFLHSYIPPIIHRDLTDTNVMFDKNGLVKIGDLGRSKSADYCTRALPGAIPFMPPEARPEQPYYNQKLDVFSLGVLMLEVATQQPPCVQPEYIGRFKEIYRRGEDLSKLEDDHPLKPLILSCLEDNPEERPDIATVHTQLLSIVEGVEDLSSIIKVPDMPMKAISYAATVHNSKVYIRASSIDECGTRISPILVYSTNEYKWSTLPQQRSSAAIAVVNNHVTLIGGQDIATRWYTNTPSTWYEEECRWKQVLPPMPTGRVRPAVISHDNLLLVTGGLAKDGSTVLNTTDVLDLNTMKWTSPEGLDLPITLWHHNLALCGEYLYLVGGNIVCPVNSPEDGNNSWAWRAKWSDVKQTAASQHSQLQNGMWTQIADPPILQPTSVSCGGTLYTVGGTTRDGIPISTVYSYLTGRNQWVSVGHMSTGRYFHCAVPTNSTVIFVAGGQVINNGEAFFSPLAELLVL